MKYRLLLPLAAMVCLLSTAGWASATIWAPPTGWAPPIGPESSWTEIRHTPDILVRAPMISFGTHAITVIDVCRQDDRLRGLTDSGQSLETPLKAIPESYTIQVFRIIGGMLQLYEFYLFSKPFTIPPCSEVAKQ